jgi:hypothetical protein
VHWNVILTLTDVSASEWSVLAPTVEEPKPGELTMTGQIAFVRRRTVDELQRWETT